jgi:transcriptional regulator with XRE-family HTH domain
MSIYRRRTEVIDRMPVMAHIGDKVKELRKERVLTQHMLADESGVSQVAIARIERNQVEPHVSTIRKLAKALGVDPTELIR